MAADHPDGTTRAKRIVVRRNGPYVVEGEVPLVRKTQVVSEYGEPLTWEKQGTLLTEAGEYHLCRCGESGDFPFCDGTHRAVHFDGAETAEGGAAARPIVTFRGGTHIIVKRDMTLCMQSGFCGLRDASIDQLVAATHDTKIRSLVMAMIERCPSGALTYRIDEASPDIEPDLPQQIAVTTEITSDGPIDGPLWVTGSVPIEHSDGRCVEARNRVTLCNCGKSSCKPLCDGTHRVLALVEGKRRRDS